MHMILCFRFQLERPQGSKDHQVLEELVIMSASTAMPGIAQVVQRLCTIKMHAPCQIGRTTAKVGETRAAIKSMLHMTTAVDCQQDSGYCRPCKSEFCTCTSRTNEQCKEMTGSTQQ